MLLIARRGRKGRGLCDLDFGLAVAEIFGFGVGC